MACAPSDTVWVGFINTIPVIGKEKLMVEWIVAYYEQNKPALIKKQLELAGILRASVEERMKRLAVTAKPDEDLPGVAEVKEAELLNYVARAEGASENKAARMKEVEERFQNTGWLAPFKPNPVLLSLMQEELRRWIRDLQDEGFFEVVTCGKDSTRKKEREKEKDNKREEAAQEEKLKEINEDAEKKIKLLGSTKYKWKLLQYTKKRAKRNEHVFNNNILRFHKDVVTELIKADLKERERLDGHTLDKNAKEEVEENMKAEFNEKELYVNANAGLYGTYSYELNLALLEIMRNWNPDSDPELSRRAEHIIDLMNNQDIYVDNMAKEKWMGTDPNRASRFQQVKDQVVTMYRDKRGVNWCIEIRVKKADGQL